LGTYSPGREVTLEVNGDKLIIHDAIDNYIIAEHKLSRIKGELVYNNNHKRDTTTGIDAIQDELWKRFNKSDESEVFIAQIRRLKPRYVRDQFTLIEKTMDIHGEMAILKALDYCVTHSLFSAVEFRNAAQYFEGRTITETEVTPKIGNIIVINSAAVSKKRDLSEYARAMKGGEQ
jgi:hypothetical protein